ncbi:MAG: hypothetical protein SGILL_007796 [Bacillariaceae sp.]
MAFSLQAAGSDFDADAVFAWQEEKAKTFGLGPISKQDVSFYIKYYGDPTEAPGPRFGLETDAGIDLYNKWLDVQRRIVLRLSTEDFKAFVLCIKGKKKGNDGVKMSSPKKRLQKLTMRILNCTDEDKEAIAAAKFKQNLRLDARVRVGTKKGRIFQVMLGGAMYSFLSDEEHSNENMRQPDIVDSNAVVPLCAGCGDEDGVYNCAKCKVVSAAHRTGSQSNSWRKTKSLYCRV